MRTSRGLKWEKKTPRAKSVQQANFVRVMSVSLQNEIQPLFLLGKKV